MTTKVSITHRNSSNGQSSKHLGFVLPMVIFLIVVLAGAAVAISQLTVDNTQSNLQALQKTRADLFNQSLVDVAVHTLVTTHDDDLADTDCPDYASTDPTDNPDPQTNPDFPGLSAELECYKSSYSTEAGVEFDLWTVTATTSSEDQDPNHEEYVWRSMTAIVEL